MKTLVKILCLLAIAVAALWLVLSAFFMINGRPLSVERTDGQDRPAQDLIGKEVDSLLRECGKHTNQNENADSILAIADSLAGYYRSDRSNIIARSSMPIQYAAGIFGTRRVYHKKAEAYAGAGDLESAREAIFNELDFFCAVGKAYGTYEYWMWGANVNAALGDIIKLAEEKPDGEWLKIAHDRTMEIDKELVAQLSRIHIADDIYRPGDTNMLLHINWPKHWLLGMLRGFPGYADYSFNPGLTQAYMRSIEGRIEPDAVGTDFCSDIRNRDISWREFFKKNWAGMMSAKNDLIAFRHMAMGNLFKLRADRMRIAFMLYRLQHGKWPEGFADLDPTIEIPKDPFDGKELRYNSKHRYFWTPGDDGNYDGTLDFDDSGRPLYTDKSVRYVELLEPKRTKPVK